ncbi:hypothetical protein [Cryobacterium sp. Y82]|uniref:hypothetical protein n=1 Tax=Cryobacterium sp. Y82 TaxID=2045017 RepID=UPI000CE44B32|nr:hypothetical protein [Cryobacterium sp. Y82]
MTTSNIRDAHDRDTENEKWLESLTIELRLLDVNGTRIGDAVATAREFLVDSGALAEESFDSARHYAAELGLPATAGASKGVWGATLRSGLGLLGLMALIEAVVPLTHQTDVTVGLGVLLITVAVLAIIAFLPRLLSTIIVRILSHGKVRAFVEGAAVGLAVTLVFVLISLWSVDRIVFSVPALPVFIVAVVLLIAPALWAQFQYPYQDDPIVPPGSASADTPRISIGIRLFLFATNWMLVIGSVILCAFVLFMDTLAR